MQDLGKMLWRMGQWEVAQSHRQIIFNLRSLYGLCCQIVNLLVIKFEFILFNSAMFPFCHFHQIVFFGIDNIHAMRDSLARLRDYLDTYGASSSDGRSSFLVSLQILYRSLLLYQC